MSGALIPGPGAPGGPPVPSDRLKFSDLGDITLLKFYELAWSENSTGRIPARELSRIKPGPVSDALFFKTVNDLTGRKLLIALKARDQVIYSISTEGITHIEALLDEPLSAPRRYEEQGAALFQNSRGSSPLVAPDAWRRPDYKGDIAPDKVAKLRDKLRGLVDGAADLSLREGERNQVKARLAAAMALAQAPTPPWGKTCEVLEPLTAVPAVAEPVGEILEILR